MKKIILTQTWISASQEPLLEDAQTSNCFREKVRIMFYGLIGNEGRNPDKLVPSGAI